MAKHLHLTSGDTTIVDDEDYDELRRYTWTLRRGVGNTKYAVAHIPEIYQRTREQGTALHRYLMHPPKGHQVDHIDGNGLDNRRCNLRIATPSQNRANVSAGRNSPTGFKGVHAYGNRWQASIGFEKKRYQLGDYDTPEEAAKAYDAKARELHGKFARLNFSD